MATIAEQLTGLANTKTAIKDAIVAKGVQVADDTPFSGYADKIGEISGGGEPVEKTKFGVGIDNFIGDVDADGKLLRRTNIEGIILSGVKSIGYEALANAFTGREIKYFIADDIESFDENALMSAFNGSRVERVSFNNLVQINSRAVFLQCFMTCQRLNHLSFAKLKKIAANSVFSSALSSTTSLVLSYDEIFPSLEELSGNSVFSTGRTYKANEIITFSKIKKITGGTAIYYATFGDFYVKDTVWNFPSATEFTGYIWNVSTSYPGEIHFAAANQAAIEACDGYANKWGFAGATIFFDL
jgi:hypothetical protein